jgi:DNA-binding CsgD family transcriptional regulator
VDAGSSLSAMNGSLHGGGLRLAGLDLGNLVGGIVQPEELLIRRHDFGPREREAVRLLARGLDTAGIARAMGVTENTARVQLHRVYVKTGVSKRKEFLELLAEYHARTSEPHSLTRVLLARLLGRN